MNALVKHPIDIRLRLSTPNSVIQPIDRDRERPGQHTKEIMQHPDRGTGYEAEWLGFLSDDGAGLPDGFDINTTGTLGLRLVKILTEDQLRGSLEVISKEGTTFNIEFDTKY